MQEGKLGPEKAQHSTEEHRTEKKLKKKFHLHVDGGPQAEEGGGGGGVTLSGRQVQGRVAPQVHLSIIIITIINIIIIIIIIIAS